MSTPNLSYPVGPFEPSGDTSASQRQEWMQTIAQFPTQMRAVVAGLNEEELQWRYRPQGWTIRQVVHHCADSHLNAYTRFKLALTEKNPTIKPYEEARWAELPDSKLPLEPSLQLLEGLHQRWYTLLQNMTDAEFERTFSHPEHGTLFSLSLTLENYDWHCRHHEAHIHQARTHRFSE
ncbi:MAG: YfiT family bacillithiol transferase [Bacteroidota bacterium]